MGACLRQKIAQLQRVEWLDQIVIEPRLARLFTVLYFAFFVLMPFYTRGESTARVPERLTSTSH